MIPGGWSVTTHSQQRRKEMGFTERQIGDVLNAPLMDLPSTQHPTRRLSFSETIVVVYEPSTKMVVTVLWRSDQVFIMRG